MIKSFLKASVAFLAVITFFAACNQPIRVEENDEEAHEKYDGPLERGLLETEKTKDPRLGYVPTERLYNALYYTEALKSSNDYRVHSTLWTERGPVYDSVGPSNGNSRAGYSYTSGRIRAVLIDANDPTGNTVFAGGVAGGLWKCTNFLSNSDPNWHNINDFFDNMAISSICQSPVNPQIMYFSTGEATSNADAVFGRGVWKSTDGGSTWSHLPATVSYNRIFKIDFDQNGNVYIATRAYGLRRSSDGGSTWEDITPSGLSGSNQTFCSDIEFTTTGKLIASFGYAGGTANVRYTTNPGAVTSADGWITTTGLTTTHHRIELASKGDTIYAAPTNTSNNVISTFRSFDGGATWTQNNVTNYTNSVTNGQGWYNLSLEVNPENALEFIVGGLDAYRSIDGGLTVSRMTYWVTNPPYVHADHHYAKWWRVGLEQRILLGTDGGLFLSRDNGLTFSDKNKNLGIKQFYSCAIHPTLTNYILAGSQDNGSHKINNPGLTYSIEVTGGDGAYVHIDQNEPQFQFTSYVYNQYRRSVNGGDNFSSFNLSNNTGRFINPFDYDDSLNVLYATYGTNRFLRWNNPTTATGVSNASTDTITVSALIRNSTNNTPSSFKVSPYTHDRLYIGGGNGQLVRVDNASTVTNATVDAHTTVLSASGFSGYLNCVEVGTSDNHLLAIFSNYGVSNIWYSGNGGSTWTAIDGNLPDMPVRWAVFEPGSNSKIIIATEAGVYTTNQVNGSSTQWFPSAGFPTVRTDMLKVRKSDNTIVAATHGRGIFTGNTAAVLPIRSITLQGTLQNDGQSALSWRSVDASNKAKYIVQFSNDGVSFSGIATLGSNHLQYKHQMQATVGYYRVMGLEPNQAAVYSNVVQLRNTRRVAGLNVKVVPNPITDQGSFIVSSSEAGNFSWTLVDMEGRTLQRGNGYLQEGGSMNQQLKTVGLAAGMYRIRIQQGRTIQTVAFVKQ